MKQIFRYPFLLIAAIILDQVFTLMGSIGPVQSVRSLVVLLCLGTIAALVIQYFVKDWHRTDFILFIFLVLWVIYRSVYHVLAGSFPQQIDYVGISLIILIGLLYSILVSRKLWLYVRKPAEVTQYFRLMCTFLLLFQLIRLGASFSIQNTAKADLTAALTSTEKIHLQSSTHPDIYIIILDAYGRQDVLQDIYGYDNSGFISGLEKRGFYVPNENHSNYIQTTYAMASLWNFDYLQPWAATADYNHYLLQPIQNNRAFQLLHEIGYTTVSFEGSLSYTQIDDVDIHLTNSLPLNKFETLTLVDTPFEPLSDIFDLKIPIPSYETHRSRVLYKFAELKEVAGTIPGPKIVYSHFLLPHPPFIFDHDGNAIPQQQPYKLWDDSESAGGEDEYRQGYREQVMFANGKILEAIDGIIAKSATPPIILIMGDHGPASMFRFDIDSPGCVWERTSNLYALRLPGHQNDGTLYATISPVNTFRVIFDTYFGATLPLLEDRTYLAASQYRDKIKDVTDSRDSRDGCTVSGE